MNYFRTPGRLFGDLHIHDGDDHVGAFKYFEEGRFRGHTLSYYYLQHRPGHKEADNASDVFSVWENLDDIFSVVSENQSVLADHLPVMNWLLTNTILLIDQKIPIEDADAWLWPDRLTDPSAVTYSMYVSIRGNINVTQDIITANETDINKANPATQKLIQLSMGLDQEFMSGKVQQVRQALRSL